MVERYFFLAGMFRSGNTLLSAILNQNPNFYVSPLSPLVEYMWICHNSNVDEEITFPNKNNKNNMISEMIKNFYKDVDKPVIFDRNKAWINSDNIYMIKKYIDKNPKILFTTRPLHECIASHINILKDILLINMNNDINNKNFFYNDKISLNDNLGEYLLYGNYYVNYKFAYNSFKNNYNNKIIHIIDYKEMVNSPKKIFSGIYDFLELEKFNHDFYNINIKEKELDYKMKYPKKLHEIRKNISLSNLDPYNILSKDIINKIKKMDLFYN